MPDGGAWRLAAPAKLNRWLTVTGRRVDGFHELDSLLVLLELADTVRTADEPGLGVTGPEAGDVAPDESNLAWRGWLAGLEGAAPRNGIELEKRVPVAAGLGGGSSDAAAAWRLARAMIGREEAPDPRAVAALATIGADVPFFAAAVPAARISGVGEQVAPHPMPDPREVVLIHPPFRLSTAAVFAELRPSDWSGAFLDGEPPRNDLLAPATRVRPELADVMRLVSAAGGEPNLSGSGSTVFVLTDDPERADDLPARLDRVRLVATRTRLRSEPASIER